MKNNKVFKNLDEQIEILKNKGLTILDEEFAKEILLRENYFFLAGYRHPFMKSKNIKEFIPKTTFDELYELFLFDRKLRNIIFRHILIIENNVKSIISYQLSKKYGYHEKDYLDYQNFNTSPDKKIQVTDLINKMKRQIRVNTATHSATMHYVENYKYIPLWVLVKVLSFGIVSELFSILKKEDQYEIVDLYHLEIEDFSSYLLILSNYRNLCAHEDIVFENKTQKFINDTKYHRLLKIELTNNEYIYGKNDLFAVIIILKSLLLDKEFNLLVNDLDSIIQQLNNNIHSIPVDKVLDRMGFPSNWKELKDIRKEELF